MSGFAFKIRNYFLLLSGFALALSASVACGQEKLLEDRWVELQTEHFTIFSQMSARQSIRFAEELEAWRKLTARVIDDTESYPKANVPNYVFLFDEEESFSLFQRNEEAAFFYQTPRGNYMALNFDEEYSLREAKHYYAHFLIRNFSDLRLPRWYEEGLAGYLSRVEINRGEPVFSEFSRQNNIRMAELAAELSMDRLLYRDDALASPRVVQIANLKSVALVHYLKHAHEQGFPDHRSDLEAYLEYILSGRAERFAFDMGFPITTEELDDELFDYLIGASPETGEVVDSFSVALPDYETSRMAVVDLATVLGELGLNSGSPSHSEFFFRNLIDSGNPSARSYSGLGDALRFQAQRDGIEIDDQQVAEYFHQAVNLAPNDVNILLDYGEYWEAELHDCDKNYPASQRLQIIADIESHFEKAIELAPNNAEANLALGQVYLFEEQDWRQGVEYQRHAFLLLPADSFIMEQSIKYSIAAGEYAEAERLINEMAQPIHFFGEPDFVTNLRDRLTSAQQDKSYDECADDA
ncbi:MAG: hypothetical protein OXU66_06415 [Gammaproteobacteria bacterium]|nr:hypothetical protein [Gammaproteobacteria bacterium]MDD9958560.1 hypothetical protein [Gammaproteobacteria bacterium]